jgi:hypothetical protein
MIAVHGDYVIDARREKALGGWDNVYYHVVRQEDGLFAMEGFYDGGATVREVIADLKGSIDAELKNAEDEGRKPWEEEYE